MVSKRSLTVVIGVLVLLTAITAATFMYIKPASTPQTKQGKVVIYAYNDRITGIDPSIEDDTGLVVLGTIYETLTYYDHETGEVKPRLAINWTSSEGGTEWTFHLRRMVSFHDGTPFNATAVKI
ncbi:MAG: ABC transporter substrate-binding protein, partial [Desulfurococcaceae archaeon]